MIFLIQTINGKVFHDFSFALIEAIDYHNWYNNKKIYDYVLSDVIYRPIQNNIQYYSLDEIIPIGTVEFVLKYLKEYHNIENVLPINIPDELNKWEFTKRNIMDFTKFKNPIKHLKIKGGIGNPKLINIFEGEYLPFLENQKVFIKSKNKIKDFTDIIQYKDIPENNDYIISDLIDIQSEWRAFIYNGKLVGLHNYDGDFRIFPDVNLICKMIFDYKNCSSAYTLDVGINHKDGTFIIEVHNFFSCGLYGFNESKILPHMFIRAFKEILENNKNQKA